MNSWPWKHEKTTQKSSIIKHKFFIYCPTAQMAEFMFPNVVYRATVYRTGVPGFPGSQGQKLGAINVNNSPLVPCFPVSQTPQVPPTPWSTGLAFCAASGPKVLSLNRPLDSDIITDFIKVRQQVSSLINPVQSHTLHINRFLWYCPKNVRLFCNISPLNCTNYLIMLVFKKQKYPNYCLDKIWWFQP